MQKRYLILGFIIAAIPIFYIGFQYYPTRGQTLQTFYGPITVTEPILTELIAHPAMQRLKKVHQYGICHYFNDRNYGEYNRFEHSIGVFALLRQYGAPLTEQIAGLLHDVSHTVFSHVGDHVFEQYDFESAYQDDIHGWYLEKCGIGTVLEKHGFCVSDVLHKKGDFPALERSLPDICADRLEYNLQGGVLEHLLTTEEVRDILDHISFTNNQWIFDDASVARKFANISLYLTEYQWGSPENQITYEWAAHALRRMLDIDELSIDDIHFGTDDIVWQKMTSSSDPMVRLATKKIVHNKRFFALTDRAQADLYIPAKFRGIDPLVQTKGGLKPLTEIDSDFATAYHHLQQVMQAGWALKETDLFALLPQLDTVIEQA